MFFRLTLFVAICAIAIAAASPSQKLREKREVMDAMKNAWGEVDKTLGDAGDAVVNVVRQRRQSITEKSTFDKIVDSVKPTEKSTFDKVVDSVKPTEKGTLDKISDSIKNVGQ